MKVKSSTSGWQPAVSQPNQVEGGRERGGDFLGKVAKDRLILLPSKTTTTEKSQRDGGCGPCGIKVTVRRLRGKRGRANERRGRRGGGGQEGEIQG